MLPINVTLSCAADSIICKEIKCDLCKNKLGTLSVIQEKVFFGDVKINFSVIFGTHFYFVFFFFIRVEGQRI